MSSRLAGAIALIGISANVAMASASPLVASAMHAPVALEQPAFVQPYDAIVLKRLGGRKRRTPADFVRPYDLTQLFVASTFDVTGR